MWMASLTFSHLHNLKQNVAVIKGHQTDVTQVVAKVIWSGWGVFQVTKLLVLHGWTNKMNSLPGRSSLMLVGSKEAFMLQRGDFSTGSEASCWSGLSLASGWHQQTAWMWPRVKISLYSVHLRRQTQGKKKIKYQSRQQRSASVILIYFFKKETKLLYSLVSRCVVPRLEGSCSPLLHAGSPLLRNLQWGQFTLSFETFHDSSASNERLTIQTERQ